MSNELTSKQTAMRVSKISIAANLALSLLKFAAGVFSHSTAMISDAVHSASDVFSTVIVMIGFVFSSKKADKDHPYGHERFECIASIVLSVILLMTGFEIGKTAFTSITGGNIEAIKTPGIMALAAAVLSIAVKELMYRYTIFYAKKINSGALKADAWHHRSDALSSVGALIGIVGARNGYAVLEPCASILICFFIVKAAVDIFKDAIDKMVDKSCDDETIDKMKSVIMGESGVVELVELQTRMFGSRVYVDAVVSANGELPLVEAHEIAQNIHDDIEREFPQVKHCMVHIDPAEKN